MGTQVTMVGGKAGRRDAGIAGLSLEQAERLIRRDREANALREFGIIGYDAYEAWIWLREAA